VPPDPAALGNTQTSVTAQDEALARKLQRDRDAEQLQRLNWRLFSPRPVVEDGEQTGEWFSPHRAGSCGRAFGDEVVLGVTSSASAAGSRGVVHGVETCGSAMACLKCATKVRAETASNIGTAMQKWIEGGGSMLLLTLTGSHSRNEQLRKVLSDFMEAWRDVTRRAAWRGSTNANGETVRIGVRVWLGIEHWIRATEITESLVNGWHPHHHVALFITNPIGTNPDYPEEVEEVRQVFDQLWAQVMAKYDRSVHTDIGVDLTPVHTLEGLGDYLSKIELEVARGDLKRARGDSRSPWQIALDAGTGDKASEAKWVEFVMGTKGRRWYSTSERLWEHFCIKQRTDEEIAEDDPDDVTPIAKIATTVYTTAIKAKAAIVTELRHLAQSSATVEVIADVLTRRLGQAVTCQHRPGDIPVLTWSSAPDRPRALATTEAEARRQDRRRRRKELSIKLYRQWVGEPDNVAQALAWAEQTVGSKLRDKQPGTGKAK
jgi:hypothetical protein